MSVLNFSYMDILTIILKRSKPYDIKRSGEPCHYYSRISFHRLHWPGLVSITREHQTGQDRQYPEARGVIHAIQSPTGPGSFLNRALAARHTELRRAGRY